MGAKPVPASAGQPGNTTGDVLSAYARSLIKVKARQLSWRCEFRRDDRRDLEQELAARLLAAAARYDPARGASADTFANRVVHAEVAALVRARRRLKRGGGGPSPRSLAETAAVIEGGVPLTLGEVVVPADLARRTGRPVPHAEADPPAAADRAADVAAAVSALPPDLRQVARVLQARPVAGVARAAGVPRGRVYAAIRQIRARFAAAGLGEPT